MQALAKAGKAAKGSAVVLQGHTWFCKNCQESLFLAGVKTLSILKTI